MSGAAAVAESPPKQVVKPPIAQAWIDVATFSGFGIGAMGPGAGSSQGMMGMTLGALMGGHAAQAEFGNTETGVAGRWMDVTLYTSRNPNLQSATQSVPPSTGLAPTLKLTSPERPKPAPPGDDSPAEFSYEPPKGKLLLYWGCSDTVRTGQPKVVDLQTATMAEFAKFFESRRSTTRGAHAAAGRPVWPSRDDKRVFPAGASIAGQHAYQGEGVPESFKFSIPAAQDIMPAVQLKQTEQPTSIRLEWNAIPTARAYFLGSMGAREGEQNTIVIWTSSELPDSGFGLFDYQTNVAVDGWLKEKVLLPPTTTTCSIPKEAAGQGMLRAIAYGSELNVAYPPRPTDPAIAWEPEWNLKIRVKSMTTTMVGMPEGAMPGSDTGEMTDAPPPDAEQAPPAEPKKKKKWNPLEALKDVVGGGG
ncbi:MAG: hypothetical protein U1F09_15190 [Steroidobacteraceae bacterium]